MSLRLVGPRFDPERDRYPVPGIDLRDGEGQSHQLGLAEFLTHLFVDFVRGVSLLDVGDRLCPGQRCAFARCVEGRLLPGESA